MPCGVILSTALLLNEIKKKKKNKKNKNKNENKKYRCGVYLPRCDVLDVCALAESSAGLWSIWDSGRSVDADVTAERDSASSTSDIATTMTMPMKTE